jgi:hypothetical protein
VEFEKKEIQIMMYETWLEHVSRHLERDGYQICKGADGIMQRRKDSSIRNCKRIHY